MDNLNPIIAAACKPFRPAPAIPEITQRALESIERCIVGEPACVKEALAAAYRLGVIDGIIQS